MLCFKLKLFLDAGWIGVDLLRPARRVLRVSSAATYLVIEDLSELAEALRHKYAFAEIVLRGDRVSTVGGISLLVVRSF